MSAPCKERWKRVKGGRLNWHKMVFLEPVQRREDTVLDSKTSKQVLCSPCLLTCLCWLSPLATRVFCVRFLAVLFLSTGQYIC